MFFTKTLSLRDVFEKYISTYSKSRKRKYFESIFLKIPDNIQNTSFSKLKYLDLCHLISKVDGRFHKGMKALFVNLYDFYGDNIHDIKNYGKLLKIAQTKTKKRKIPFSEYEIKQLWLNSDNEDIKNILILIYTGMRISEFLNLKKEDIDLDKKFLIVKKSKTPSGTNRIIPLHRDIIPFFKSFDNNMNYSRFNLKFKKIMYLLKMNHTIHECRHTFSTILSKTKARQHIIKKILGHANYDVTNIYIHVKLEDLLSTISLLKGKKIVKSVFSKDDFYLR